MKKVHKMSENKNLNTVPDNCSEYCGSPTPICILGEESRVTTRKKRSENNSASPRKRQRVVAQAVTAKGRTRKAVTETETPNKRPRTVTGHVGKTINVSVIDLTNTSDELSVTQRSVSPITTEMKKTGRVSEPCCSTGTKCSLVPINTCREYCGSPTPICILGEESRVTTRKRKSEKYSASPRKRQRVVAQAVTAKGRKRKAVTETETPNKRPRTVTGHVGKTTNVSVIDLTNTSDELSVTQRNVSPITTEMKKTGRVSEPCCSTVTKFSLVPINTSRDDFNAKYMEIYKLGKGNFGSVYAGNRITDFLPVAIKHIPKESVEYQQKVIKNVEYHIPLEVLIMHELAAGEASVGTSEAVSLLDWYNLDTEVLLIMERPIYSVDLSHYLAPLLEEHLAKEIMKQLVDAAIELHSKRIFHRDIKCENVLIEIDHAGPRVRLIDFGCSCFVNNKPFTDLCGTPLFFAPEMLRERIYEATPTTVWQLGALLHVMLGGRRRFYSCIYRKVKLTDCKSIEIADDFNVTQDCKDLMKMCLTMDPKERATLEQLQSHPWFNLTLTNQTPPT